MESQSGEQWRDDTAEHLRYQKAMIANGGVPLGSSGDPVVDAYVEGEMRKDPSLAAKRAELQAESRRLDREMLDKRFEENRLAVEKQNRESPPWWGRLSDSPGVLTPEDSDESSIWFEPRSASEMSHEGDDNFY
jgi:hypothetical protein